MVANSEARKRLETYVGPAVNLELNPEDVANLLEILDHAHRLHPLHRQGRQGLPWLTGMQFRLLLCRKALTEMENT